MKVPQVVDLQSLQHLPDALKKAHLQKIQSEIMACLPSLPHLPDLQRLKDELKTSLASMDMFPSLPRLHLLELLSNCLPQRFSHTNQTNVCALADTHCLIQFFASILHFFSEICLNIACSVT